MARPRGQIVVFEPPASGRGETDVGNAVKRVIALAGEQVACCDAQGSVTVDGAPLHEPYLGEDVRIAPFEPVTVPLGSCG